MTRRKVNLRILIGLPASGKSTFAQDFAKDKYERVETFGEVEAQQSCSFMGEKNQRCEPMKTEVLHKRLDERLYYRPSTLIVDGLFLTTDRVMDLIDFVSAATELQSITLDYWPENKEECLLNDYMRRRIGSALSIKNLHINVDFKTIKEKYPNVKVKHHTVYHTPDYVLFSREHGLQELEDERYLCSDTWCKGGEGWSCTGNRWPIDADDPPESFRELSDLLYGIRPDFAMKDYQYIMAHCVEIKEKEDSDYYSRTTLAQYVCDLESLYSVLKERGYLEQAEAFTESERELLQMIQKKTPEEMSELERLCYKLARCKVRDNNE